MQIAEAARSAMLPGGLIPPAPLWMPPPKALVRPPKRHAMRIGPRSAAVLYRKAPAVVGGAFSIEGLFGGGDTGFYLDFQDLSTLYQDTSFTTPVTTDGQEIQGVQDKSGSGRDFIYNATHGSPLIWYDATNDFARIGETPGGKGRSLESTSSFMYAAGACTMFFAIKANPAGTGRYLILESSSSSTGPVYTIRGDATTSTIGSEWIRNDTPTTLTNAGLQITGAFDDTDNVLIITDTGSLLSGYLDGALIDTQSYTRSGTATFDQIIIGGYRSTGGISSALLCDMYATGAIDRVLDSEEIAGATTKLGEKMGLSL